MEGSTGERAGRALWEAGAQPERTGLSWQRTAMSLVVLLMLILRTGPGALSQAVVVLGMLTMGYLLLLPTQRYLRTSDRLTGRRPLPDPAPLAALGFAVSISGVGALAVILVG